MCDWFGREVRPFALLDRHMWNGRAEYVISGSPKRLQTFQSIVDYNFMGSINKPRLAILRSLDQQSWHSPAVQSGMHGQSHQYFTGRKYELIR